MACHSWAVVLNQKETMGKGRSAIEMVCQATVAQRSLR
jgi:hypothetical protein